MGNISSKSEAKKSYVVFFDLDDTLLNVNSGKVLVGEAYRRRLMRKRDLLLGIYLSILYKLNLAHSTKVIIKMAYWLKGVKEDKIMNLSEVICDKFLFEEISRSMIKEVEIHREQNARLVLLSAALPYICVPIAKFLRLDDVICSLLQVEEGKFTGLPKGRLVFGAEKKVRIEAYCQHYGLALEQAFCYADSFSDLPVLEIVGNAVCVRPDRRLGRIARKRGWRVMNG